MASELLDLAPRRLHPSSLLFRLIGHAKGLLVPGLAVLLWRGGEGDWEIWLMILFIPSTIFEIVRYFTLRYRLQEGEVIVNQGLIFRNERHIPLGRIQNVDLVQNPLHRLFKVAEVRLETGSGGEPEAVLKVLSLDAVSTLRARVFGERGRAHRAVPAEASADSSASGAPLTEDRESAVRLLTLPTVELVKLGLVSNRGLALVLIAVGLAWEFDLFERIDITDRLTAGVRQAPVLGVAFVLVVSAIAAVLGLYVLSIIWTILRFHGFTLERSGDDVRVNCGLLTRRSATIPRRRIQFVSIHESPVHRLFQRVSVRIETAGGKEDEDSISRKWFIPLAPKSVAEALIRDVCPSFDCSNAEWRPLAPKARRRMVIGAIIRGLLVSLIPAAVFRPWGAMAVLLFVPALVMLALLEARYISYARTRNGLAFRAGALIRRISATVCPKMQVVEIQESPFDRRYRMAALHVDTAGAGPAGHRIRVPYLEVDVTRRLHDELAAESGRSALRW